MLSLADLLVEYLYRHVSFMRHFFKHADHINVKYVAEITELYILQSEAITTVGHHPLLLSRQHYWASRPM